MRILFDQGTPVPLRQHLPNHQVTTAYDMGWSRLGDGELLQKAEDSGFDILVTTDRNLRYQQDLARRKIAVVVLATPSWPRIRSTIAAVVEAIDFATVNGYVEVPIPFNS